MLLDLGLDVNFGANFFEKTTNDPFSNGLLGYGSQSSPCYHKNNEITNKANSIFDGVLSCQSDQSITSSKSTEAPIGGLNVNSTSSIDSSSRSSPTSSVGGSTGTPGCGNIRIPIENFVKGNRWNQTYFINLFSFIFNKQIANTFS